jgi:hypothetical protein
LLSAHHGLINSIWNNEELLDEWKKSIIVPIHKKGDKIDCNNYHRISLLSTLHKIFVEYPIKIKSVCRWVWTKQINY